MKLTRYGFATGFGFAAVLVSLTGCNRDPQTSGSSSARGASSRYEITVDGGGFHPNQLSLPVGLPATLVLTRTTDQTCAREIVVPALKLRQALPLNHPVELAVTPREKGQIAFACGMNMMTGVIDVR